MKCYLHIGMTKTGTSAIQSMLSQNRKKLLQKGYLYPRTPGNDRHVELCWYAHGDEWTKSSPAWIRSKWQDPSKFRSDFKNRLEDELNRKKADYVIFSDEALWSLSAERKIYLRDFLQKYFNSIKVIIYLRRQDDRLISAYQQQVKTGCKFTLNEFVQRRLKKINVRKDRLETINQPIIHVGYYNILSSWADFFGHDNIIPKIYEKSAWQQGSLARDFLSAIGLENAPDIAEPIYNNPSLDATRVEFLRLFNHTLPEVPDPVADDMRIRLRKFLMRISGPNMLSLPEEELDNVMQHFEASNCQVAREFFGREDGILFREPRKQTTTTTKVDLNVNDCMELFHEVLLQFTKDLRGLERKTSFLSWKHKKMEDNKKTFLLEKILNFIKRYRNR